MSSGHFEGETSLEWVGRDATETAAHPHLDDLGRQKVFSEMLAFASM